jgi:23S rRNA (pseudouridine1915-N3)-methyltransferase
MGFAARLHDKIAKIELRFGMHIYLYFVGKPRDANANRMAEEYIRRSSRYSKCEMREIRPGRFDPWEKHPSATKILLDPAGKSMESRQFAKLIGRAEQEARDLVFLVGGADGLPEGWRTRNAMLLSLTPLTLPHELARVVLAEQIYRAFTMLRGHPYPR